MLEESDTPVVLEFWIDTRLLGVHVQPSADHLTTVQGLQQDVFVNYLPTRNVDDTQPTLLGERKLLC